jgi:tetratricopeptide (TPR) repeat protein
MSAKICLCIMAKQEATTIEKAVETCRPYVDHVLISVDSKSTDGTIDVAKEIADTVMIHEFETDETPYGSFARIRNAYMDAAMEAGCDYVVHLDGHEYMESPTKETFHSLIEKNPEVEAFGIDLFMNGTKIRQMRMNKLSPKIRYVGDIHNFMSGHSRETYCSDIVFVHDRADQPKEYIKERDVQRTTMSEKILQQRIDDNPKDSRSMFYLAQSHKENKKFEEAIELFYQYLEVSKFPAERWNARDYLSKCLMAVNRKEEAYKVIEDSLEEKPQRAEAWIFLGDIAYRDGDFEKAIECYKKATETPRPNVVVFIHEDAYTWFSYDKLSMAYHQCNRYLDAIRAAAFSLQGEPNKNQLKRIGKNIQFWSSQVKKMFEG